MNNLVFSVLLLSVCRAQEASSGLQAEATLSAGAAFSKLLSESPRNGSPMTGGFRLMLYPVWKISEHWSFLGAVQVHSRPYFAEEFDTQGYGVKADILQAQLAYTRHKTNRALTIRVGQMSSAFGSFLLRYDDARNPLINSPISYGYYEKGVTSLGLIGAQVDAIAGRFDFRAQLVNSSPANRRAMYDKDQYANWAGGAGYTIAQGVRAGVSVYRGPYLNRGSEYFFPGEARPRDLPATALGIEFEAARGPWNFFAEAQKFEYNYRAIPTFREQAGYAELKRTLHPRWYAAIRVDRLSAPYGLRQTLYETVVGFRPNRRQLLKFGYQRPEGPQFPGSLGPVFGIQLVTRLDPISFTRD